MITTGEVIDNLISVGLDSSAAVDRMPLSITKPFSFPLCHHQSTQQIKPTFHLSVCPLYLLLNLKMTL